MVIRISNGKVSDVLRIAYARWAVLHISFTFKERNFIASLKIEFLYSATSYIFAYIRCPAISQTFTTFIKHSINAIPNLQCKYISSVLSTSMQSSSPETSKAIRNTCSYTRRRQTVLLSRIDQSIPLTQFSFILECVQRRFDCITGRPGFPIDAAK